MSVAETAGNRVRYLGQSTVVCVSRLFFSGCLFIISKMVEAQSLPPDVPAPPACASADNRSDRRLAFGVQGRIQRVAVKLGDRVKGGTRLASLDCGSLEADLQTASAELDVVRAEYEVRKGSGREGELTVAEARLRAAQAVQQDVEATRTRLKQLAAKGGVVLERELSDVARRLVNAELDVVTAQSNLERIRNPLTEPEHEYWRMRQKAREAAVGRAQLEIDKCAVRAPRAGTVEKILHYEGEFVDELEPVVVVRIEATTGTPP